jgi:excisionase family DNA binding protein
MDGLFFPRKAMSEQITQGLKAFYKVGDLMTILNISRAFIYARLADGSLSFFRLGQGTGGIRVSEEQLQAYLASREKKGAEKPVDVLPPIPRKLKHLHLLDTV